MECRQHIYCLLYLTVFCFLTVTSFLFLTLVYSYVKEISPCCYLQMTVHSEAQCLERCHIWVSLWMFCSPLIVCAQVNVSFNQLNIECEILYSIFYIQFYNCNLECENEDFFLSVYLKRNLCASNKAFILCEKNPEEIEICNWILHCWPTVFSLYSEVMKIFFLQTK